MAHEKVEQSIVIHAHHGWSKAEKKASHHKHNHNITGITVHHVLQFLNARQNARSTKKAVALRCVFVDELHGSSDARSHGATCATSSPQRTLYTDFNAA